MSDRAEVELTILEAVVKGYNEALSPSVSGINLLSSRKEGIGVTDDDCGQIGHLQRELVTVL